MYEAIEDPYCYPGTNILKNRLNLRDPAKLAEFEAFITAQRADEPLPAGNLDYRHYCAIHRHLFQDVYSWAGRLRTVRLSKGDSTFCYPEHIDREMRRLFANLRAQNYLRKLGVRTFAEKAAHLVAELNAIHPFREGNGRTQLTYLTILADRTGHPLALEGLNSKAMIASVIKSFQGDERALVEVIGDLVQR